MKRWEQLMLSAALGALVMMGVSAPSAVADQGCKDKETVSDLGDDGGAHQLRQQLASVCAGGEVQIVPGTIALQQGALVLDKDIAVRGLGPAANPTVIDAGHASRVIDVVGAHASLHGVTVTGGSAPGGGNDGNGGAIRNTAGALELSNVTVSDSFASNAGGGIANIGTLTSPASLTLVGTTVAGNTATVGGGGIANVARGGNAQLVATDSAITDNVVTGPSFPVAPGGGILSTSSIPAQGGRLLVTLQGSTLVASNRAQIGGGIFSNGVAFAEVTLRDTSSVSWNTSLQQGGGIFSIAQVGGSAVLTLQDDSQVTGNHAQGNGGGVFNEGTLVLAGRSRLEGNTAVTGAGLFNFGFIPGVSATMQDEAEIRGNTASNVGGGVAQVIQSPGSASLTLRDLSSIHDNTANLANPFSGGGIANVGGMVSVLLNASVTSNHPNDCSGAVCS